MFKNLLLYKIHKPCIYTNKDSKYTQYSHNYNCIIATVHVIKPLYMYTVTAIENYKDSLSSSDLQMTQLH